MTTDGPQQAQANTGGIFKNYWNYFAQAATWLLAAIGLFVIHPPGLALGDDRRMVPFAGFVVTALVGLASFLLYKWRARRFAERWWMAGAVLVGLSIATFFLYDKQLAEFTESFATTRVVIGTPRDLTPVGKRAIKAYKTNSNMLKKFGGQANLLWGNHQLENRRRQMAFTYVACVAACALTVICIIQAIRCQRPKKNPLE